MEPDCFVDYPPLKVYRAEAAARSTGPTRTRRVGGMKKYVRAAPISKMTAMIYSAADGFEETCFAQMGMLGPT